MSKSETPPDNASGDPRPDSEEELSLNLDRYLEKEEETEEQRLFNDLSVQDKLGRLNKLVQQSQVYSQIILDNMLEKSMQKKKLQEKIDKGEVVPTTQVPGFDTASSEESESESESEESESEDEEESQSSDDDVIVTTRSTRRSAALSTKKKPAARTQRNSGSEVIDLDSEVIEVDLDPSSDDEVAPSRRTRSAGSAKRRVLLPNPPRKRAKKVTKRKKKKTKKPKSKASKETKDARRAIEAAQTGHKQVQPILVSGCTMKDYQLDGLEWLVTLYENGLNGILADEMGLGKTLQCIALTAHLLEHGVKGPFLVVAPLSTVSNWCREFERFSPRIKVLQYMGPKPRRQKITFGKLLRAQVVVTSYEIMIQDHAKFQRTNWTYLTVDEGHRLKNFDCILIKFLKKLHVGNRLLLTGTPLQNNLKELWSLLNFILPDIFHDLELFQLWFDFEDLGASIGGVDEKEKSILKMKVQELFIKNLHSILKPFLLRRMKKDVMKDLPAKKEYIIYSHLTPIQKVFYKAILDRQLPDFVLKAYIKEYLLLNHGDQFKSEDDFKDVDEYLAKMSVGSFHGQKRSRQTRFDGADIQRIEQGINSDLEESDYEELDSEVQSELETESKKGLADLDDLEAQYEKQFGGEVTEYSNDIGDKPIFPNSTYSLSPSDAGSTRDMSEHNSSSTVQSTPDYDESSKSSSREFNLREEFHSDVHKVNEEDEIIEISSGDEEPTDDRFAIVKKLNHKFGPYVRRLALRNVIMQMRKTCFSHYCYYTPYLPESHYEEKLAKRLVENSGKMQLLRQLIVRLLKDGHKTLIFSQFTSALDHIRVYLEDEGVVCSQLDGRDGQDEREEQIKDFSSDSEDSSQVFLLSTRAGGLGLNLVKADTVILFDNDWNPQMDLQAIGRVHRIGQTKPVKIFRFVVRDTVEELLIIKSFNKRLLEKLVIQEGNFQLGRVAKRLAAEKIDLSSKTSISSLLEIGDRLNLHGSGDKQIPLEKFNEILVLPPAVQEPLTNEEIEELMDRSNECYSREALSLPNVTSFETTNNMDDR